MSRQADMQTMLSTAQARRVWWSEIEALGVFAMSLVPDATGSVDVWRTAFQEGRRSLAIDRIAEARALVPDTFRLVVLENLAPPKEPTDAR